MQPLLDLCPGEDGFCSSKTKPDRRMAKRPNLLFSARKLK
jgi:hypothetical protein